MILMGYIMSFENDNAIFRKEKGKSAKKNKHHYKNIIRIKKKSKRINRK